MQIKTQYLTKNPYFNDGKYISSPNLKGFFLHSIGVSQENAQAIMSYWNNPSYTTACVNGFIDNSGAYITLPTFEQPGRVKRGPHAGKRSTNDTYIGFEMTEPKCIKYVGGATFTCSNPDYARAFVEKNMQNAVKLFAKLCSFHHLNPLEPNVILGHAEGYRLGMATNHGDPEHLWKQLGMDWTMDKFRQAVYQEMHGQSNKEDDDFMNKEQILTELGDKYITEFSELPAWAGEIRSLLDSGIINGGTSAQVNPNDINMYLSDIKAVLICKRMIEAATGKKI